MEFQFGEVYIVISMNLKDKLASFKAIMPNGELGMLAVKLEIQYIKQGSWDAQFRDITYHKGDKISEREALNL